MRVSNILANALKLRIVCDFRKVNQKDKLPIKFLIRNPLILSSMYCKLNFNIIYILIARAFFTVEFQLAAFCAFDLPNFTFQGLCF